MFDFLMVLLCSKELPNLQFLKLAPCFRYLQIIILNFVCLCMNAMIAFLIPNIGTVTRLASEIITYLFLKKV